MAPVATRNTMLVAACAAGALAIVAPVLLPALFGAEYDDSVRGAVAAAAGHGRAHRLEGADELHLQPRDAAGEHAASRCVSLVVTRDRAVRAGAAVRRQRRGRGIVAGVRRALLRRAVRVPAHLRRAGARRDPAAPFGRRALHAMPRAACFRAQLPARAARAYERGDAARSWRVSMNVEPVAAGRTPAHRGAGRLRRRPHALVAALVHRARPRRPRDLVLPAARAARRRRRCTSCGSVPTAAAPRPAAGGTGRGGRVPRGLLRARARRCDIARRGCGACCARSRRTCSTRTSSSSTASTARLRASIRTS